MTTDVILHHHNSIRKNLKKKIVSKKKLIKRIKKNFFNFILKFSQPIWKKLDQFKKANKILFFEGAQGVMLDVDHGTYPFVTASNTVSGASQIGSGCGPNTINYILRHNQGIHHQSRKWAICQQSLKI